jgi:hypothetical protein
MNPFIKRLSILAGIASLALAAQLNAITISTSIGAVTLGQGSGNSPADEVNMINNLRGLTNAGENAPVFVPLGDDGTFANTGTSTYDRFNTAIGAPNNAAVLAGSVKVDVGGPFAQINVGSGFNWLLIKYGDNDYVWNISGMTGTIDVPTTLGSGGGQSHYSLYNPAPTVPDGGMTVAMLGAGLGLLALLRRKIRA